LIVDGSYTEIYLHGADGPREHGLEREAAQGGFRAALVSKMSAYWQEALVPEDLKVRLDEAREIDRHPLTYAPRPGTRIDFVGNRLDRTIHASVIEAAARRLKTAGAETHVDFFDDIHGHSAFFRAVPAPLARALDALVPR
jgi:hypothetical protein